MTVKSQNCGYVYWSDEYNYCSMCVLVRSKNIECNNLAEREKDKDKFKASIFKITNKITNKITQGMTESVLNPLTNRS